MSAFNPEDYVSPQNLTVQIESRTIPLNQAGGTTQTKFSTQNQFRKLCAKFKIVNEDPVNAITYRIPSPSAPLRTVPPSTSTLVEEYTYYLEFNYDILNVTSYVEVDLVNSKDVKTRDSMVGRGSA